MTQTIEIDRKAIERANGYRQMMSSWAWKDFQNILNAKRTEALEKGIDCNDIKDVQLQRGIVKCIDSIATDIGYIVGDSL